MLISGAICDKCGKQALWTTNMNKGIAISRIRREGWSVNPNVRNENGYKTERTLCPMCRKKRLHNKEV